MRILVVSDEIDQTLYSKHVNNVVGPVDLVVSCGDLPFYYLEFLVSTLNVPGYFVFGNHGFDTEIRSDERGKAHPRVGVNLDGQIANERGLLLAGLEGSMRYNRNPRFQYTEQEMWVRAVRLLPQLQLNRLRHGRYLDVLVTHAPPYKIHDKPDLCHTGFRSFRWLMRRFRPRYLLHGHIHVYGPRQNLVTRYHETDVVNVYPYRIIEVEPKQS